MNVDTYPSISPFCTHIGLVAMPSKHPMPLLLFNHLHIHTMYITTRTSTDDVQHHTIHVLTTNIQHNTIHVLNKVQHKKQTCHDTKTTQCTYILLHACNMACTTCAQYHIYTTTICTTCTQYHLYTTPSAQCVHITTCT